MDVKKRRRDVEKLYKRGTKSGKIAKLLGVSVRTVERDISFLREHNREKKGEMTLSVHSEIISRRKKDVPKVVKRSKQIAKRRETVAKLYTEGKTAREIAEELETSMSIIYQDIRLLVEEGKIEKRERSRKNTKKVGRKRSEETTKRRETVAKLYKEGKTAREIAEELETSMSIIYQDIRLLVKEGKIEKRERSRKNTEKVGRKRSEETTPQENKYMKIESLYRNNKSFGEIADELDLSIIEVIEYLQQIKLNKSTETTNIDRRTMVKRLYEEGKSVEEIASNLNISEALVKEDLLTFGIIPGIEVVREKRKEEESQDKQEADGEKEEVANIPKSHILSIKERRKKVRNLYDEGVEEEEIASMLGISVRVVKRDIENILEARMIQDKSTKVEIADEVKKEKEESIRTKEEEMYYNSMIRSIKLFIQKGEFNNVVEYIKMLKREVKLTRLEIEKLDKLVELIIVRLYKGRDSLEDISKKLNIDEAIVRRYIDISMTEKIQETNSEGEEK